MAHCSLKDDTVNKFDFTVEALQDMQLDALAGWYSHFTHKYPIRGKLKEFRDGGGLGKIDEGRSE